MEIKSPGVKWDRLLSYTTKFNPGLFIFLILHNGHYDWIPTKK